MTIDEKQYETIGAFGDEMSGILPDEGWKCVSGRTEKLGEIYREIYKNGSLMYEIEMFDDEEKMICHIKKHYL